jgi:hypothetical protein
LCLRWEAKWGKPQPVDPIFRVEPATSCDILANVEERPRQVRDVFRIWNAVTLIYEVQ